MIPAPRLLALLALLFLPAAIASVWPNLGWIWPVSLGVAALFILVDAAAGWIGSKPSATRLAPEHLPLGVWRDVRLILSNAGRRHLVAEAFDHYPSAADVRGLPLRVSLGAGQTAEVTYSLRALERGLAQFGPTQLRVKSPLGLWWLNLAPGLPQSVKVYPDFAEVAQYIALATRRHLALIGVHRRRRRGEGSEFHQLREYREGDALRSVDWKATSRLRKLVAREYQEERGQHIVFLLDCGQRMRAQDDELSHFDHALRSVLLLAWIALQQGDAVGFGSFGGASRWMQAGKGKGHFRELLGKVYDLQPTPEAADYNAAAAELLARHPRRCLVVLVTNLRDDDDAELLPALAALRRRHRVLLASLREQSLDNALAAPVRNLADALRVCGVADYFARRETTLKRIDAHGFTRVDTTPAHLSVALINEYLRIKAAGAA